VTSSPPPNSSVRSRTATSGWPRLWLAICPLEDALKLAHLYSAKESPKFEKAAMRFLRRLDERSPTLKNFAKVVDELARRERD
jgi:hypothetical protein